MQSLERMRQRIGSAEELYSVVRVMKALAAANVRHCEKTVESLAQYSLAIELGLQIVLRTRPELTSWSESPAARRWGIIVCGSDQGMCGSFNEQIMAYVLEHVNALPEQLRAPAVLAVGSRIAGRLEDAGYEVAERFPQPSTASGISLVVQDILLKMEELRFRQGIHHMLVIHHKPASAAHCRPHQAQVFPVDRHWLQDLARRPWPSRCLPMYTMPWQQLFSLLVRQHLFVMLHRALADSLASENVSRLNSMQAAEKNIREHISELTVGYHQGRQQLITEELLDIVAGFEMLITKEE